MHGTLYCGYGYIPLRFGRRGVGGGGGGGCGGGGGNVVRRMGTQQQQQYLLGNDCPAESLKHHRPVAR